MGRVKDGVESHRNFKIRMQSCGDWGKAVRFRESTRQRLNDEHLDWDFKTISREAWLLTIAAFPGDSVLGCVDLATRSTRKVPVSVAVSIESLVDSLPALDDVGLVADELPVIRHHVDLGLNADAAVLVERNSTLHPSQSQVRVEARKRDSKTTGAKAVLLAEALSRSDRGGVQEDTEWCYQNLDVLWDDIEVVTVPSPGAVALLAEAKVDKKWFLTTYHAKLLPTKSKFESEGWFETDDNRIREMADGVRDELSLRVADGV